MAVCSVILALVLALVHTNGTLHVVSVCFDLLDTNINDWMCKNQLRKCKLHLVIF